MPLPMQCRKVAAFIMMIPFFLPVKGFAGTIIDTGTMEMETEKIEIVVGKSRVLRLKETVSRMSIGNPEIADYLELPADKDKLPTQIYLRGNAVGVTNLIFWQEDHVAAVYDIEVSYDVSRLKEKLYQILPDEKEIQVFATNDKITLLGKVANNGNLSRALAAARSYVPEDKVNNLLQVGGTHQIMLEVVVSEMNRSLGKQMGIDVSFFNETGDMGATLLGPLGRNLPNLLNPEPFYEGDGLGGFNTVFSEEAGNSISKAANAFFRFSSNSSAWTAFLKALQEDDLVKILSEPNLITLSGQPASFLVGGEFPILVPSTDGISIDYKEYGVGLQFTPFVLAPDRISVKVQTEVSELDKTLSVTLGGISAPGLKTRKAATTIELGDGQSFAIAGLLSENTTENIKKFPFLGDLPLLGTLFKSTDFLKNETELVILVTPRFVKPMDGRTQPLPTDAYTEPTDSEIYFNLKKAYPVSEESDMIMQGKMDGEFGHAFED